MPTSDRNFTRGGASLNESRAPGANPEDVELARLYRLQVRHMEDAALFLIDPEGRITTWNRGVETAFGYTEPEWIGQHTRIIFTEEDEAAGVVLNEIATARAQGQVADIRWHRRKDGTRIYMHGVLRALRDESGTLIGYSKMCLDYTDRKRMEDALTQSNIDLEQFAFLASHDIQEPLRQISAFAQILQRRYGGQIDQEADQLIRYITDGADRMGALVRDLLSFSRIAQDEGQVTSVHLDDDVEAAVSLLRRSVEETGAVITHDALPDVKAERGQMVRLFQNLISNSIKFRKPGEQPRIHVSVERNSHEWKFRLRDNGIGFAPEHAENIFAPFKRLQSAKDYPGTGLGLATCRRIVERYGGRIWAESQPGRGATFCFTMPVE